MPKTKEQETSAPKARADWEAIERDYRTGRFTLRELSAKYGPDPATIMRRAKRDEWPKDLTAAVRLATEAKLAAAATRDAARAQHVAETQHVAQQGVAAAVDSVAASNADVILEHRAGSSRVAEVTRGILEEVAAAAAIDADRELIAEVLAGGSEDPKRMAEAREAIQRALGVGARAATVAKLAEALAKAQAMQRQAHRLDDNPPPPPPADLSAIPPERAMEAYLALVAARR